jgi:hypothetical protein
VDGRIGHLTVSALILQKAVIPSSSRANRSAFGQPDDRLRDASFLISGNESLTRFAHRSLTMP